MRRPIRRSSAARWIRAGAWTTGQGGRYIVVDLDFGTAEEADAFLKFLRTKVWSSPQSVPALAGTPQTRTLELCEEQ